MLLSSVLEDCGRLSHSFHVSCMALCVEAAGHPFLDNELQFLDFLVDKCSASLLPRRSRSRITMPQISKASCLRMACQLSKIEIFAPIDYIPSNSLDPKFDIGLDLIVESADLHPLLSILVSFRKLNQSDSTIGNSCAFQFVCFMVEVMALFGQSLSKTAGKQGPEKQNFEAALKNLHLFLGLLCQMIIELKVQYPEVFTGILSLAAYTAIAPGDTILENDAQGLGIAIFLFKESATTILKEAIDRLGARRGEANYSHVALCESIRITLRKILFDQSHVSEKFQPSSELINDCISVADCLVNASHLVNKDKLLTWAMHCTISALSELQNNVESLGDQINAVILSFWTFALSQEFSSCRSWFASSVFTVCLKDGSRIGLGRSSMVQLSRTNDDIQQQETASWIFEKENLICHMRVELLQTGMDDELNLNAMMKTLQEIKTEAEKFHYEGDDSLHILHLWLLSTIYLAELDANVAGGCYADALESSQMCLRYCQAIMKRVGPTSRNGDSWIPALASSTVLSRSLRRYIAVLSRRPMLYYRIGDHRKAAAYMRSALDFCRFETKSTNLKDVHGNPVEDLIKALVLAPLGLKSQIRLFLEIRSWSSTQEIIIEAFSKFTPAILVPSEQDSLEGIGNHCIESVQDLFLGKKLFND